MANHDTSAGDMDVENDGGGRMGNTISSTSQSAEPGGQRITAQVPVAWVTCNKRYESPVGRRHFVQVGSRTTRLARHPGLLGAPVGDVVSIGGGSGVWHAPGAVRPDGRKPCGRTKWRPKGGIGGMAMRPEATQANQSGA